LFEGRVGRGQPARTPSPRFVNGLGLFSHWWRATFSRSPSTSVRKGPNRSQTGATGFVRVVPDPPSLFSHWWRATWRRSGDRGVLFRGRDIGGEAVHSSKRFARPCLGYEPFTNRGDGVRAGCPRPTLPSNNNRLAPRLRPSRSSGPGGSGAQKRGVRSNNAEAELRVNECAFVVRGQGESRERLTDTSFRSQIAANTAGKSRARVPRRLDHAMSDRVSRPKTTERATFGRGNWSSPPLNKAPSG
jgi:hypothetical protein